jgi:hypothetical protein
MPQRPQTTHTSGERARALLFLGLFLAGVAAVLVPELRRLVPPCGFRWLTGLYCAGCGTSRAMAALARGDLLTALRMNALAVVVVVPVFVGLVRNALEAFGLRVWDWPRVHPSLIWAFGVAVLIFWIARNLPFVPFTFLAPG